MNNISYILWLEVKWQQGMFAVQSAQAFHHKYIELVYNLGRAIAQAVSRWLPTAAARVPSQVRSCGICGEQNGTGADFLRVLRFPLPILIPPTAP
jgi:hypothetical protein